MNDYKFSQLDITEDFGDNLRLTSEDWIQTIPLVLSAGYLTDKGLPAKSATEEEIYAIALDMSTTREAAGFKGDGVYCPVCHIANIEISKLGSPCQQCKRALLRFGWD